MIGSVLLAVKPPPPRTNFAAKPQAATTDGSSTTIGMGTVRPLITKFSATPIGSAKVEMAFSIM